VAGDDLVTVDAPIARSESEPSELARGVIVGRYVVLQPLGSGGGGTVYVAYDPELDRKVALKLMHVASDHGDVTVTEAHGRMILMRSLSPKKTGGGPLCDKPKDWRTFREDCTRC
jgi:hypothetical protein